MLEPVAVEQSRGVEQLLFRLRDPDVDLRQRCRRQVLLHSRGTRFVEQRRLPGHDLNRTRDGRQLDGRRHRLHFRRDQRMPRVVDGGEQAVSDFAIALGDVLALLLHQQLQLLVVGSYRVNEVAVLKRQDVGVGQPDDRGATGLRQRSPVGEVGVEEVRVEVEVVVDRVIDAALVLAAVADVQRRDAEMLEKRREVGARPERADAPVRPARGPFLSLPASLRRWPSPACASRRSAWFRDPGCRARRR